MPSDLEQQSSELVVQAARLVRAIRRRISQPAGIRILALLEELGPMGVTALADADRSSQPTVSGALRQLEEEGWVAKNVDPADARRALVELTPRGRQRLLDARRDNGKAVAERLARTGHSAEDVAHAVKVLRDVMAERL
ncbi:MAG TPA: MarR family transcriptional regulator [Nocardioides sp.]|nr:MarR family transcriptional regulator [Nocardioides sp.]